MFDRFATWLGRVLCRGHRGHEYLRTRAGRRAFLVCVHCGHETPGWEPQRYRPPPPADAFGHPMRPAVDHFGHPLPPPGMARAAASGSVFKFRR